jgi:septal ring factor EnvC (AmiA/AmiB activator)
MQCYNIYSLKVSLSFAFPYSSQQWFFQTLEQRVETLERELDAAIAAAARARNEKRQAEAAQKSAEFRSQEIMKELESTSSMSLI